MEIFVELYNNIIITILYRMSLLLSAGSWFEQLHKRDE